MQRREFLLAGGLSGLASPLIAGDLSLPPSATLPRRMYEWHNQLDTIIRKIVNEASPSYGASEFVEFTGISMIHVKCEVAEALEQTPYCRRSWQYFEPYEHTEGLIRAYLGLARHRAGQDNSLLYFLYPSFYFRNFGRQGHQAYAVTLHTLEFPSAAVRDEYFRKHGIREFDVRRPSWERERAAVEPIPELDVGTLADHDARLDRIIAGWKNRPNDPGWEQSFADFTGVPVLQICSETFRERFYARPWNRDASCRCSVDVDNRDGETPHELLARFYRRVIDVFAREHRVSGLRMLTSPTEHRHSEGDDPFRISAYWLDGITELSSDLATLGLSESDVVWPINTKKVNYHDGRSETSAPGLAGGA